MGKIKSLIQTFRGDKAIWHFFDDFSTFAIAGIPAALTAFELPADADGKALGAAIVGLFLAVAQPALRRAWAQDKADVAGSVYSDLGLDQAKVEQQIANIHQLLILAERAKETADPAAYQKLIDQIAADIDALVATKAPTAQ